jgi:subtilisin family serine protease
MLVELPELPKPGAGAGFGPRGGVALPPAPPKVKVENLSPAEAREAREQPGLFAAEPIRTRLIKPTNTAGAKPAAVAWGIEATRADISSFTGAGIKVAVLDTGIDANHEAFAGITIEQEDFTGEGNGDGHGHGTHCAGTIVGRDVGGTRIGVARGVTELYVGKVLGGTGGSSQALVDGILAAVKSQAQIVSMSIGIDFPGAVKDWTAAGVPVQAATSRALEAYLDNIRLFEAVVAFLTASAAFGSSAIVVAASGNESKRTIAKPYTIDVSPPAVAAGVVSVGAIGKTRASFTVAPFSNTGPKAVGPGVDITSAKAGGGLVSFNGTSMATPHVAGVAALWAEKMVLDGGLDITALAATVTGSAIPIQGLTRSDIGSGLVQAPA